MKPHHDITDPELAKALAHPLRTRLLGALEDRVASPSELAVELDVNVGTLSYHMRRLAALGFVKLVKRVPRRGAVEHYYTAVKRPRITSKAWAETPTIVKQATIRAALAQVGHYVNDAAVTGGFEVDEAHLTRSPMTLDERGWREVADVLDAMVERVKKIEEQSKDRLKRADHQHERSATLVLMLFESSPEAPAGVSRGASARRGRKTSTR